MDLDDATRAELASFFARRFPTAALRARVAGHAGLPAADLPADANVAWRALVDRAADRGRLTPLLDAARAAAPGDANLEELSRLLVPTPRAKGAPIGVLNAVLVVAVTAAGLTLGVVVPRLWHGQGPSSEAENAADPVPAPAVGATSTETTVPAGDAARPDGREPPEPASEPPPPAPEPAAPAPDRSAEPPVAPREPETVEPVAARRPAAPDPGRAETSGAADAPFGCDVLGDRVGWWFQPGAAPGEQGETITLPSSLNVRLDFPRAENGYSRGASVVCRLRGGTTYALSHAPVRGGPSGWWVPVTRSDLGG